MGVNTAPRVASDDGSGNEWDWRRWGAEMDGTGDTVAADTARDATLRDLEDDLDRPDRPDLQGGIGYSVRDVGARALRGEATPGITPDVRTNQVMPRHTTPRRLGNMSLKPYGAPARNNKRYGYGWA